MMTTASGSRYRLGALDPRIREVLDLTGERVGEGQGGGGREGLLDLAGQHASGRYVV
jgi:hypothetical protein